MSTSPYSCCNNEVKLDTWQSLGVGIQVPPWPPPFMPSEDLIGVADFKQQARTQQELESRMTQMQEGEDDVDIASLDTTVPSIQQGPMTGARPRQLNYQVKSFLDVHTNPS
jgi:hypothetical protein